jgi:catechol 2,3-dioxygenase-like lactoylglutathione lyase family enzyme
MAIETLQVIPLLRIFSVEKAKEFYVGFLGFTIDWEHRFDDNAPLYMQVSKGRCVLHLTEHHGDCCPGSTVFVWLTGIEELHRDLAAKQYRYMRPGLERTGYGSLCVSVIDPFGNCIRFNEDVKTKV